VDGKATYGIHVASERALQEEDIKKFTESDFEKTENRRTLKREERTIMIKKTGDLALAAGTEEVIAVNNAKSDDLAIEDKAVSVEHPELQEKINLVIHEWLTDMWLLTTGEQLNADSTLHKKHNGRPLAIVCDGQMKLTESKPSTLNALRAVGIEMS
jgi:hypothetical protein